MSVRRILVGTDGSEHAQRAVRWAAGIAARTGAQVVAAPPRRWPSWPRSC